MRIFLNEPTSNILVDYIKKNHELVNDLSICDIAISRNKTMSKLEIDSAPNLKLIAVHGTGYNMIDINYAKNKGIMVFNTPNLNTNAVAELNLMFALMLARKYNIASKTDMLCDILAMGSELENKTIGFIGVGNIANKTAKLLEAFNVNLIGFNRSKKESIIKLHPLDYVLENSDYIFITIALNKDTEEIVNKEAFNKMKKCPYLINSSRGGLVNNDDLYNALKDKKIKGYAADVYNPEPINKDNPILKENVIILPHIGANTKEALDKMANAVIKGIEEFINGNDINNRLV